jgi:hypothetical protein
MNLGERACCKQYATTQTQVSRCKMGAVNNAVHIGGHVFPNVDTSVSSLLADFDSC